jgi:Lipocalin-like domain
MSAIRPACPRAKMNRTTLTFLATVATLAALPTSARSQEANEASLVGSWRLTAVYDQFTDGRRRDTWGNNPQGMLQFAPNGLFTAAIMAGDRAPRAGTVPSDPVGPAFAYYGTYEVNTSAKTFTFHVQQSTWPQWNGATLNRTITELTPRSLKVVAAPIRDPQGGEFQPHLEFERIP